MTRIYVFILFDIFRALLSKIDRQALILVQEARVAM